MKMAIGYAFGPKFTFVGVYLLAGRCKVKWKDSPLHPKTSDNYVLCLKLHSYIAC